jgi:streptogramin lyase
MRILQSPGPIVLALASAALSTFASAQIPGTTVTPLTTTPQIAPARLKSDGLGVIWFTDQTYRQSVGFFGTDNVATVFPIPITSPGNQDIAIPQDIAVDANGNAWFPWVHALGDGTPVETFVSRVTHAGSFTTFTVPTVDACSNANCKIARGPDGNMWMTEQNKGKIARITPAGAITEFALPNPFSFPSGITAGADGNLWFTEYSNQKIGRMTPAGVLTEFGFATRFPNPYGITAGPDGNIWFTESGAPVGSDGNKIGRITPAGVITEFVLPTPNSSPTGIITGADGNLWFGLAGTKQVGRLLFSSVTGSLTTGAIRPEASTIVPLWNFVSTGDMDPDGLADGYVDPYFIVVPNSITQPVRISVSGFDFVADHFVGLSMSQAPPCPTLSIIDVDLLNGRSILTGSNFSSHFLAQGGTPPYKYGIHVSPTDSDVDVDPVGIDQTTGALSGWLEGKRNTDHEVYVSVTDANGCRASLDLFVHGGLNPSCQGTPPSLPKTTGNVVAGFEGRLAFGLGPEAADETFLYTGDLPSGMSLDVQVAPPEISFVGTPTVPGKYTPVLHAHDGNGCVATSNLEISVLPGGPCASSATVGCFQDNRFSLSVNFLNPNSQIPGQGQAVSLTSDTTYFWFFSPNNVELVNKVLDGRGVNNFYWLFSGALTDVPYTISLLDTTNGQFKYYTEPGGLFSFADTSAAGSGVVGPSSQLLSSVSTRPFLSGQVAAAPCVPSALALCLNSNRFQVSVVWRVPSQGTSGQGTGTPITGDTGRFWFFSPNNIELVLKVLDGRSINGKFWVFYGALSNVEYTITVTDTQTGAVKTYLNPSGTLASVADTAAF